jgi:alpha-tubulin suppressor-like RCC1 family protein
VAVVVVVVSVAGACGAGGTNSATPPVSASTPEPSPNPTADATFPLVPRPPILPIKVAGLEHAIDVSASYWTQCAVLAAGTVDCWGDTWMDVHGYGLDGEALTKPTPMAGVSDVVQVAVGGGIICAVERVGTVMCWGLTIGGDFQANPTDMWVARLEPGIIGATSISAGFKSACAVLIGGKVICWGDSGRSSPASNVTAVAPGGQEDDFLLADGTVAFRPVSGTPRSDVVGLVPGLTDVVGIAAGDLSSCAVVRVGLVYCWGTIHTGSSATGLQPTPRGLWPSPE